MVQFRALSTNSGSVANFARIPRLNLSSMKTNLHTHPIPGFTSVNAEERKSLGVKAGDTVRVHQKIKEKGKKGERIRIQVFEGLVLATKHGSEPGATFTVRKVSSGTGIERIFPLYSPTIDKIEIVKRAKVRRAKLYHIREKVAKEIKRAMRRSSFLNSTTISDAEYQEQLEQERVALEEAEAQAAQASEAEVTGEEVPEEHVAPVEEAAEADTAPVQATEEQTEDAPAEESDEALAHEDEEVTEEAAEEQADTEESSETTEESTETEENKDK
jgi:large subunit ribosomal protein L19